MKIPTDQTRRLLEQALRSMPRVFALQGARAHVLSALNQVGEVERKRARGERQDREEANDLQRRSREAATGFPSWEMSLPQAQQALRNLDRMIQQETSNPKGNDPGPTRGSDDDLQTLLD